jgi:NPCBM/NEW2 domain
MSVAPCPLPDQDRQLLAAFVREGSEGALRGSAIFTILGDGKELFRSNLLRAGKTETPRINLTGVHELELRVNGGEGPPPAPCRPGHRESRRSARSGLGLGNLTLKTARLRPSPFALRPSPGKWSFQSRRQPIGDAPAPLNLAVQQSPFN